MKQKFLALLWVFTLLPVFGQQFSLRLEVRSEEDNSLIPGARVELIESHQKFYLPDGVLQVQLTHPTHHLHITSLGYETKELDIDLSRKSDYVAYLHMTSIELKESVIQHDLVSSSDRNASITITGLDREALLLSNAGSFAENLEAIPGVSTINVGVGIAKPVIRGLSGVRIVVADAGLKQEGQQWGNDHGLEMDQYGIERLEVIKGPASVIFGPDAMGGVVHILPEVWPAEGKLLIDVLAGGKSNNGTGFGSLGVKGTKDNFFFSARSSYKNYGDMAIRSDSFNYQSFRLPVYDGRLKNTAGREFNLSGQLGYKGDWGKVYVKASRYELNQGLFSGAIGKPQAYGLGHENNFRDIELPSQHVVHTKVDAHSQFRIKKSMLHIDAGFQRNDRLEQSIADYHGYSPVITSDTAHHFVLDTWQMRLYSKTTFSPATKLTYGTQVMWQQNRIEGFEYLIPNFRSFESGLFVLLEHNFSEKWATNFGVRGDFATLTSQSFSQPVYNVNLEIEEYQELSPDINRNFVNGGAQVGFSYHPTHHSNLKFNLGKTYRFPRAVELAVNGVHHGTFRHEQGDAGLVPENGYQVDLSYEYHTNNFLFTVTPFFNYYQKFIFLRPTGTFSTLPDAGQLFRYTQANALLTGAELLTEYHPWEWWHIALKAQYVYGYNLESNRNLPFIPPLETTLEWEFIYKGKARVRNLFFKPQATYVFAQNFVDANEKATPGFFLVHADVGMTLQISKQQEMIISLGVRNALNNAYYRHLSRYRILDLTEQGINIIGSIRFPLEFSF
jgi:iron complex outermembrane recepter protein